MDAMTPQQFLQEHLQQQARKVVPYQLHGRRVWVKAAGPSTPWLLFRLLTMIIRWLGLAPLRPINNRGGADAIAIESARLRTLGALGLPVPRLLASQTDGILIEDLGQTSASVNLHQALATSQDTASRVSLLQQALDALAQVHVRDSYLSQAFARNMIFMPDGGIGFIDFEEDPGQDLTLAECQARDVLCLIFSVSLFFADADSQRQVLPLFAGYLRRQSADSRAASLTAMRKLGWLRHLPGNPAFGKDTVRAQATGALFKGLADQLT